MTSALRALSLANILRGGHGAGVAFGNKTVRVAKTAKTSANLDLSSVTGRFIGGHTRYATSKHLGKKNTHPFISGPITMMHNGVINPAARARMVGMGGKKCDVDSEEIAHALAKKPCDDVISALINERANFCLIWHDARDGGVRIVRETSRPLHMIKYQGGILYSSEDEDLSWGAAKGSGIGVGAIKQLNPYVLLESLPDEEITARKLPEPPSPPVYTSHYNTVHSKMGNTVLPECDICNERPATGVSYGCNICYQCKKEIDE